MIKGFGDIGDLYDELDAANERIEKLEAALRNVAVTLDSEEIPYMVRNRYACATAEEALENK